MKIENELPGGAGDQTVPAEYLNKRQVARLLGVSVRTIDNLMRDHRLPYLKLTPKLVRFPKAEVERHLNRHFRINPMRGIASEASWEASENQQN